MYNLYALVSYRINGYYIMLTFSFAFTITSKIRAMMYQHYLIRDYIACVSSLIIIVHTWQRASGYEGYKARIPECTSSSLQNTTCHPVNTIFETGAKSAAECFLQCFRGSNKDCLAFYYNSGNQRCVGCDNIYNGYAYKPPQSYHGNRYYHRIIQKPFFRYLGCYNDMPWPNHVFYYQPLVYSKLTRRICFNYCYSYSFMYFGLQDGNQCYCGNININYTKHGIPDYGGCYTPCVGNSRQACGGYYKTSMYMIIPVV